MIILVFKSQTSTTLNYIIRKVNIIFHVAIQTMYLHFIIYFKNSIHFSDCKMKYRDCKNSHDIKNIEETSTTSTIER